jgi:predicted nucleotide-binding protein
MRTPTTILTQPAKLTAQGMQQGIQRLMARIEEVKGFDVNALVADSADALVDPLRASIDDALVRTFGNGTIEYNRYNSASDFDWPRNIYERTSTDEIRRSVSVAKGASIALLESAIASLRERLAEQGIDDASGMLAVTPKPTSANRRVFIVHGHDEGPLTSVARFLKKLEFEEVILREQANQGRTIIEKFEAHADVGFAVILLTPDDEGRAKGKELQARARQNVILELGYFIGRLGRSRVCALKSAGLEIPSDILGVVWTEYDANGGWQRGLAQELQAAGYDIDWNRVMRP